MLGAGRVIAIDNVPERLAMAQTFGKAQTINFDEQSVFETLDAMTVGRGPDHRRRRHRGPWRGLGGFRRGQCQKDTPCRLGPASRAARSYHELSQGRHDLHPDVYIGFLDKMPIGAFMNKVTLKTGQTHTHRYLATLLQKTVDGSIDPSFVITHRVGLDRGPDLYKTFRDKQDSCIKVVLKP